MIEHKVKKFYTEYGIKEWRRLVKDPFHQLEWKTSWLYLDRYLPRKGTILDAGGGPGRYTIELAKRGYKVVLLDLVPKFLDIAKRNAKKAGVLDRIEFVEGTVEDLPFDDNTFDAVLSLGGVLSHLVKKEKRLRAADELTRVLKPGKPLFISVIGRIHVSMLATIKPGYHDDMINHPRAFMKYCVQGDYYGNFGFTPVHLYDVDELENEFNDKIEVLKMVGLEGVFSPNPKAYNRMYKNKPETRDILWKLHLATCEDKCVVATSQHFMLIGKK